MVIIVIDDGGAIIITFWGRAYNNEQVVILLAHFKLKMGFMKYLFIIPSIHKMYKGCTRISVWSVGRPGDQAVGRSVNLLQILSRKLLPQFWTDSHET